MRRCPFILKRTTPRAIVACAATREPELAPAAADPCGEAENTRDEQSHRPGLGHGEAAPTVNPCQFSAVEVHWICEIDPWNWITACSSKPVSVSPAPSA
jgi:hypothetical protein